MRHTKIISAFPGCGKTYTTNYINELKESNLKIIDSDSSDFSWIKDEEGTNTDKRNPEFPQNYINHIKENIGIKDIIFVSSHKVVRDALRDNKIDYILICPTKDEKTKEVWMKRFKDRGNSEKFIKTVCENWKKWIEEIEEENFPLKLWLHEDESIYDYLIPLYIPMELY